MNYINNDIEQFLSKKEYISNDKSITLYDLIQRINTDYNSIQNKLYGKDSLPDKLNNKKSLFNKTVYSVYYSVENEFMDITIDRYKNKKFDKRIRILKELNSDRIETNDEKVLQNNYTDILRSFSNIEKYKYLFLKNNLIVNDGIFSVNINFNHVFGIKVSISLNNKNENNFLLKGILSSDSLQYRDEILKRIPVTIKDLPELYQTSLDKQNIKVKTI